MIAETARRSDSHCAGRFVRSLPRSGHRDVRRRTGYGIDVWRIETDTGVVVGLGAGMHDAASYDVGRGHIAGVGAAAIGVERQPERTPAAAEGAVVDAHSGSGAVSAAAPLEGKVVDGVIDLLAARGRAAYELRIHARRSDDEFRIRRVLCDEIGRAHV